VDKYDQMLTNLVALLEENNKRGRPIKVELSIKPTPEARKDILNHPDFQCIQALTSQDLRKLVRLGSGANIPKTCANCHMYRPGE
jgi:hypothetical protein